MVKVRRYDNLKKEEDAIKRLVRLGVIGYVVERDLKIFEEFESKPELCSECRYEMISYKFKLSSDRVRKIITSLKKEEVLRIA